MMNQNGATLIIVMLVFLLLSILGVTLLSLTTTNIKMTIAERDFQSVYYIAEAGINNEVHFLKSIIMDLYRDTSNAKTFFQEFETYLPQKSKDTNTPPTFESYFGKTPYVSITSQSIPNSEDKKTYLINSKGTIGNISRTVQTTLTISHVPKEINGFDCVIFSERDILIDGNHIINGNIYTNGKINAKGLKLDPNSVEEGLNRKYILPEFPETLPQEPNKLKVNKGSEVIISESKFFLKEIDVDGELIFVVDGVLKVRTNDFKLKKDGSVTITGKGKLLLYVDYFDGKGKFNYNGDASSAIVLVNDPGMFSLKGYSNFSGGVYAPNSDVELYDNVNFTGAVISGIFSLLGNTTIKYIAIPSEGIPINEVNTTLTLDDLCHQGPLEEQ